MQASRGQAGGQELPRSWRSWQSYADVPAVLPMVPECKAPKEGGSVTLACLVTGSDSATWHIGAQELPANDFVMGHLQKMGHVGEMVPYLFYQTFDWKPVPYSCSTKSVSKTFQWPASWKTQKDEAKLTTSVTHTSPFSEKLTPMTTTTRGPALLATSAHKDTRPPEPFHDPGTARLRPAAPTAPSSLAVRVLATPGAQASAGGASWLLCEVSGFSPPELLLTWQEGPRQVDSSWFATAVPTAEPGKSTFRTWSVLRVPATPGPPPATYTCEVRHTASERLLNASWSLDTAAPQAAPGCGDSIACRAGHQGSGHQAPGPGLAPQWLSVSMATDRCSLNFHFAEDP